MTQDELRSLGLVPCPPRWNAAYAERVRAAWTTSSMPMLAFSRVLGAPASLVKYWLCARGKPRAKSASSTRSSKPVPPASRNEQVALREVTLPRGPSRIAAFELRFSSHLRVRVPHDFDPDALRRLVAVLTEARS